MTQTVWQSSWQSVRTGWREWKRKSRMASDARRLGVPFSEPVDWRPMVSRAIHGRSIRSCQKPSEIAGLLERMERIRPRRIVEIGARGGGTLLLLALAAAPDAQILSMDIDYTPLQISTYEKFARPQQRITCVRADSHDPDTVARVQEWLGSDSLDVLFIDGDHTWNGVSDDFRNYAPYVRTGGLIAFHDINPDFNTRHGTPTAMDTGEVPAFWKHLRPLLAEAEELIENPNQDGYGIGVVHWSGQMP